MHRARVGNHGADPGHRAPAETAADGRRHLRGVGPVAGPAALRTPDGAIRGQRRLALAWATGLGYWPGLLVWAVVAEHAAAGAVGRLGLVPGVLVRVVEHLGTRQLRVHAAGP